MPPPPNFLQPHPTLPSHFQPSWLMKDRYQQPQTQTFISCLPQERRLIHYLLNGSTFDRNRKHDTPGNNNIHPPDNQRSLSLLWNSNTTGRTYFHETSYVRSDIPSLPTFRNAVTTSNDESYLFLGLTLMDASMPTI